MANFGVSIKMLCFECCLNQPEPINYYKNSMYHSIAHAITIVNTATLQFIINCVKLLLSTSNVICEQVPFPFQFLHSSSIVELNSKFNPTQHCLSVWKPVKQTQRKRCALHYLWLFLQRDSVRTSNAHKYASLNVIFIITTLLFYFLKQSKINMLHEKL